LFGEGFMKEFNLDDFFNRIEERKYQKDTENVILEPRPEVEKLMNEICDYKPEN
jgi:hypothetical protein